MSFEFFSDADWNNAQVDETKLEGGGSYKKAPEGSYIWVVTNVKEKRASTGTPYVELEFEVADGPYATAKEWKKYFKLQYLKEDIVRMGANPDTFFNDHEAIVERMFHGDKRVEHKNGYENVRIYINGPYDPNEDAETQDYSDLTKQVAQTFPEAQQSSVPRF